MSVAAVALSLSPSDTTPRNPPLIRDLAAWHDYPTPRHDLIEARLTGQAT